jgi:flagellar hook-length control protein FliK
MATTAADVGDNNGQSATSSKTGQGATFNDLMATSAQAPAPGSSNDVSEAETAVLKQEGDVAAADTDRADAELAALAAASNVAARGVTLKQTPPQSGEPSLDATPLRVVIPALETQGDEMRQFIASQSVTPGTSADDAAFSAHALLAVEPTKPASADTATPADDADLAAQAVMAVDAARAVPAPDQAKTDPDSAAPEEVVIPVQSITDIGSITVGQTPSIATMTPPVSEAEKTVETLTDLPATALENTGADKPEANHAEISKPTPPVVSALRAVAWFPLTATDKGTEEPNAQANRIAADTEIDFDQRDADPAVDQPLTAAHIAPADPTAELRAYLDGLPSPLIVQNAPGEIVQPPPGSTTNSRIVETVQSEPQAMTDARGLVVNGDARAISPSMLPKHDSTSTNVSQAPSGNKGAAVAKEQAPAQNEPALATQAGTKAGDARTVRTADIRGLAKTSPEAMYQGAITTGNPNEQLAYEHASRKTAATVDEARQLETAQSDMRDEAKSADEGKQADKNTVNIRELLKFGVTDVSLSIDPPPTLQQTTTEVTQTLQTTAQTVSQTVQTQATPMASTSVETNGERRTIADDIRLRALERMIVNAARNGTQILSIQLYPPGLGQVVLRLAMDGQRLRLATRAATTEAADTLRNMEADLRDALSGNGLQLAGFDVSEDGTNDEAPHRKPTQPEVKTRSGGTTESFTVDLNA